ALRSIADQPQMSGGGPGESIGDKIWKRPKAPLDISRLKLPFGTTAAGIAAFLPGKEKVTKVKFSVLFGFDDRMRSREWLDIPAGVTPRFLYLWPPNEISYFDSGANRYKTATVHWKFSKEPQWDAVDFAAAFGIPVVSLDSWINPNDTTVAMVWPADNATANLFQTTRATDDGG